MALEAGNFVCSLGFYGLVEELNLSGHIMGLWNIQPMGKTRNPRADPSRNEARIGTIMPSSKNGTRFAGVGGEEERLRK